MNPRRILVALTLALVVSGGCTWLVARRLSTPAVVQLHPDAMYAAPARVLHAGDVLKLEDLELVAWPSTDLIDGAFTKTPDLVGREVLFPLSKGQPILDSDLSARGSGTGLAGEIPDGMRAVALRSDEVVGVAGFLAPGSHLDVLVTYRSDLSPEPVTATVVQDAVVIAAGQQIEPDPSGKPSSVAVVTLLLTPEQSERAVLASTQGAIHFVLRNSGDAARTHESPMLLSQLAGDTPTPEHTAVHKAPVIAAPQQHGIETVLGGDGDGAAGAAQRTARPDGGPRP